MLSQNSMKLKWVKTMRANEFIFEANMSWASLGKHEGKSTDDGRREDFLDKIKN